MGKHGCLVLGPAGSGKSTFCAALERHAAALRREYVFVNLDPAADSVEYGASIDVRELICTEVVAREHQLGPNGALVKCMEYLSENMEWLYQAMHDAGPGDDEFFVFDCPGQIELYTHVPAMRKICDDLRFSFGMTLCGIFLVDSMMVAGDASKYLSAVLLATSSMLQLELPWVNVLTKTDLLRSSNRYRPRFNDHENKARRDEEADDEDDEDDDDLEDLLEVDFSRLSVQLEDSMRSNPSPLDRKWMSLNKVRTHVCIPSRMS